MLKIQTSALRVCAALALAAAIAAPAAAQSAVGAADIDRLQNELYQATSDVQRMRNDDWDTAARLQRELDDARDEVIYLKVKLRREGRVSRAEFVEIRNKVANIRSRSRADNWNRETGTGGTAPGSRTNPPSTYPTYPSTTPDRRDDRNRTQGNTTIPVGQEIDVRLQTALTSDSAQVEDRFEATTVVDLYSGDRVLIPAGSAMRGVVRSVEKADRLNRKGSLTVAFDQVEVNGRSYPLRGTVTQALESEGIRGEVPRIGAGAGVGAIIGGIIGGVKGALLGILIGGGGTIAATEGKDVHLEPGTILRVRLDSPPAIR
jgi:hypothetical protein